MRHYRVTYEDVIVAHNEALKYGGAEGVLSEHQIRSAVGRPYSGYHRRIHQKAAALMEAITNNHGFVDGNKRTALLVTDLLIRRSGYSLMLGKSEAFDDIIVEVADGKIKFEELSFWFSERLVRAA